MIYLSLFLEFIKIGLFSFGGAYSSIPLIEEAVIKNGWMSVSEFTDMVAVSESTPGPIMVNLATYVGNTQGGIVGAIVATLAVVLPAFVIILLIVMLFKTLIKKPVVIGIMDGIKPCIVGIILATGIYMLFSNIVRPSFDYIALIIAGVLVAIEILYKLIFKKYFPPIGLIICSAVLGAVLY